MPWTLVRTQGRTWRRRRATGRENQPGSKGRAPPNRGTDKPQEGPREELQVGPAEEQPEGPLEGLQEGPSREDR